MKFSYRYISSWDAGGSGIARVFSLASILDVSFNTVKLLARLDEPLEREERHAASDR